MGAVEFDDTFDDEPYIVSLSEEEFRRRLGIKTTSNEINNIFIPSDTLIPHWAISNSLSYKGVDVKTLEGYMKIWHIKKKPYHYHDLALVLQVKPVVVSDGKFEEIYKIAGNKLKLGFEFIERKVIPPKFVEKQNIFYGSSSIGDTSDAWYNNI